MKSLCLVVLYILFFAPFGQGQGAPDLNSVYKGGEDAFYRLFASQLRNPDKSAVGVSIISWKVENGKVLNASILNSLGNSTDKELLRVLALTGKDWIQADSTVQYYLPVKFKTNEFDFFVDDKPDSFLEELVVVSYGTNKNKKFKTDDLLVAELNGFLTEKKFEKGISILDQLILRNPFNQQIRETRVYALNQLGKFEAACQDVRFIEDFIGSESKYKCEQNH